MNLNPTHPHIQDWPALLRVMAAALAELHASQRAHGGIKDGQLQSWLTEGGETLCKEKFIQAALPEAKAEPHAIHEDVQAFAAYSIGLIRQPQADDNQPFQASMYSGKEWPDVFLGLLQSITSAGCQSCVTMESLSAALTQPAPMAVTAESEGDVAAHQPASPLVKVALPPAEKAPPAVSFALPNATVGKPYHLEPGRIAKAIARQRKENEDTASIAHLQLPDGCGLTFDKITGAVSGTPACVFEGPLSLGYAPSSSAALVPITISLLINPNPASLWKDLPPPADAPYQKSLLADSEQICGPFRIVAASRRGRSHAQKAEFRDDDYAVGYAAETQWLVVVVADGAGSATYSRRGSQLACETAKEYLTTVLNSPQHNQAEALYAQHRDWQHPEVRLALRSLLYAAAYKAHMRLTEEVQNPPDGLPKPLTLRNFDTTLILMVMKKCGEGVVAATFAIGDGGAGILPNPAEGMPLTRADSGEHAGQTIFLTFPSTLANTEENLESRFQLVEAPEFTSALVMTDGITDPKFPSDAAFADPAQWAALWAEVQPTLAKSADLLDWMNFFSPGNHDDRTLVAVLPVQTTAPATP